MTKTSQKIWQWGLLTATETGQPLNPRNPASTVWLHESNQVFDEEVAFQKRFEDPDTGIPILRLTSQPCINQNIYPEAQISTPDGRQFIFARSLPLSGHTTFWIADLETQAIRQITDEEGASAPVVTPDGNWFYYSVGHTLKRMSSQTFERETVFILPEELAWVGGIRTVDYSGTRFLTAARGPSGLYGVARIDLVDQTVQMIFEGKDVRNAHPQYSHNSARKVLVQVNDGIVMDENDNILRLVGENGASLFVMDDDGSNPVRLKLGFTHLLRIQGHQCWIGRENAVISAMHRREHTSFPWIQDCLMWASIDNPEPRIAGQGEGFTHIHTTPDGEFWVSDCNRTAKIFIGSCKTGRYRLLCNSQATFGAAQEAHPHPFFLGDGKTVGWNSDGSGIPHIYCARIPEGFLTDLL